MLTPALSRFLEDAAPLFVLALVVSSLGFRRLVYFVSLGYAFSTAGMALFSGWRFRGALDPALVGHCVGLAAYGLRLGTYLVRREREPAYQRELADVQARAVGIGRGKQVLIWVGVSLLYVLMFTPALFGLQRLADGRATVWPVWLALFVMLAGFLLETVADLQKAAFKRARPDRFCDVKLYRLVRCPNYLGEVIFWTGSFFAGVPSYTTWWQWLAAGVGYVCIVLIMVGSTKRLERKQDERYGALPEYQAYVRGVPVLFPFVPVYSLKNVRVYLE